MSKKHLITESQRIQFNTMLAALLRIGKRYQTPQQLRKSAEKDYGVDADEAIEMAYENIQNEASLACKRVKPINPTQP